MPRAIWSGSITFGLVNVPVKLYSAVAPKDVHFHQVHDADGVRIQQKRICPADGKEVPYEHIAKGYEVAPNQYVILKREELEALDPKKTHTIDIESFVDLKQIDPLFFEHSYYLVPDKGAGKAYALLMAAMDETDKVAIAKCVLRTKQYVCAVRPTGKALSMATLYYHDEVVDQKALEELPGETKLNEKELAMARQLVESLSQKFDPKKYHDDYRDQLLKLIEKKAEGQDVVVQPVQPEPRAKVVNLMEALQASLAEARKGSATVTRSKPRKEQKTRAAQKRKHTA